MAVFGGCGGITWNSFVKAVTASYRHLAGPINDRIRPLLKSSDKAIQLKANDFKILMLRKLHGRN